MAKRKGDKRINKNTTQKTNDRATHVLLIQEQLIPASIWVQPRFCSWVRVFHPCSFRCGVLVLFSVALRIVLNITLVKIIF